MLGRERVRSRNSLEVLALLPRYDTTRHGGDDTHDDDHTMLRRVLIWRVLTPILAPLMASSQEWRHSSLDAHPGEAFSADDDAGNEFAYLGEQILFGELRHVFAAPLLYIVGGCVCVCVCASVL